MAQTGYTPAQLYRSTTASAVPSAGNLAAGELAINTTDEKLYFKNASGTVKLLAANVTPVANGGTGATTASTALTNLGAVAKAGDTMTGVLAFTAGTVSAPGITFSSDTNTGIFSPAADTIAFTEGGVESMRIDSSGNVGIGTSSPSEKLVVGSGGNLLLAGASTGDQSIRVGSGRSGNGYSFLDLQGDTTYSNGLRLIRNNSGANAASNIEHRGTGALQMVTQEAAPITFFTSATERMRIDSSGNLLVGTTSSTIASKIPKFISYQTAAEPAAAFYVNTTSNANQIIFVNPNGEVGAINTNGSTTAYGTSSDYRLKRDVQPMVSGLSTIVALKPSTYKWNVDSSYGEGFIAHELAEHIPLAVTGEKDATNEDGSIKSQGVDYSKIVVHLVAAIQELSAKVAVLEGKQ
jgi:hypothetical protein